MQHSTEARYLSGNLQILGPIRLFTVLKERPVTTYPNMALSSVCFFQGHEDPAGNFKQS